MNQTDSNFKKIIARVQQRYCGCDSKSIIDKKNGSTTQPACQIICEATTGFIESNGINLFYRRTYCLDPNVNNPTLLFLHGLGASSANWTCQQKFFCEQGYTTIAFDFRGFGRSDKPTDPSQYTLDIFINDIRNVINHFDLVNPFIIGHSLGGYLALRYALLYQNELSGIATIGAFASLADATTDATNTIGQFIFTEQNLSKFVGAFLGFGFNEECNNIACLKETSIKIGLQENLQSLQALLSQIIPDLTQNLLNINIPVFIVQGTIDALTNPRTGNKIHNAINTNKTGAGNASLYEVRQKGHFLFTTDVPTFNTALIDFLNPNVCHVCNIIEP